MTDDDPEDVTRAVPEPHASGSGFPLIPGFHVRRLIGRGGMARVFEAYEESMHRTVALKVIDAGFDLDDAGTARFENEAWIAGRLSHPHIVKVYGQGQSGRTRWFSMELVAGPSLHVEIQRLRQLYGSARQEGRPSRSESVRQMVNLFIGVSDALGYVHGQGLVHRDIKPSNLLLDSSGARLMVSDFGIARDVQASRVTRAGDMLGTVHYMSPEQVAAHRVDIDHRTDIWSLGVSLYEALTLELPFEAGTAEGYMSALMTRQPAPPRSKTSAISRDLETVLLKCLEKDPAKRYASASDLKDDLDRVANGQPVLARRPGAMRRAAEHMKNTRSLIATALLSAAAIGLGASWWHRSVQREEALVRSRWALEEAITKNVAPQEVAPDWNALEVPLRSAIESNPTGELSKLAQRASCEVSVKSWPTFASGGVGGVVEWARRRWSLVQALPPFVCDFAIETSLDKGAWSPADVFLGSAFMFIPWDGQSVFPGDLPTPNDMRFDRNSGFVGPQQSRIPAGVHHVEIRATVSVMDASALPRLTERSLERVLSRRFDLESERAPDLVAFRIALRRAVVRSTERRPLGTYTFTLLREFPPDFPNAVMPRTGEPSVPGAFQVQKILIERLQRGPEVIRMRFTGVFGNAPVVPIAADAELHLEGVEGAVRFQVAFTGSQAWVQAHPAQVSAHEVGTYDLRKLPDYPGPGKVGYGSYNYPQLPGVEVPLPVRDGEYAGRLLLHPSRDAARRTGTLERYLDLSFEQAVSVQVRTLQ